MRDALRRADLEAHLCALVLGYGKRLRDGPFYREVEDLLRTEIELNLKTAHDVAVRGVRVALGVSCSDDTFRAAAAREFSREPLLPVACVRDDELLLLGVAAGSGGSADLDRAGISAIEPLSKSLRGALAAASAGSLAACGSFADGAFASELPTLIHRHGSPDNATTAVYLFYLLTAIEAEGTSTEDGSLEVMLTEARSSATQWFAANSASLSDLDVAMFVAAISSAPRVALQDRRALERLLDVIELFPASAAVLRTRNRSDAEPYIIQSEADVQDLFHAVVLHIVPDIVAEDPASKIAGTSSRLDFTSKQLRMGFELKYVRSKRHAKGTVRDELLIDEATYQQHPYVDRVLVFVYDPGGHIPLAERRAFEADLSQVVSIGKRTVEYVVRVR